MAINDVTQQTTNYEVFVNGNRYLGSASVDSPEIEYITKEISGAGIGGKIDVPTLSHLNNVEITLHWRNIFERPVYLMSQDTFIVSLRSAVQQYDAATGVLKVLPVRIDMRVFSASTNFGSLEPATNAENETKFHPDYIKVVVAGVTLFEHDKFNFKHVVNGKDFMAQVRTALGI